MTSATMPDGVIADFEAAGIEVHRDAVRLLELACANQLESGRVRSKDELAEITSLVTPNLVSAYRFKFGDAPMTFGRAVRLIGDIADRWKDLVDQRQGS